MDVNRIYSSIADQCSDEILLHIYYRRAWSVSYQRYASESIQTYHKLKIAVFRPNTYRHFNYKDYNDIEAINNVFAQGVITMAADFLTLLAVVGIMFYSSWRLTLIVFITMPFMIITSYIFKEKVKVSYQKVRTQIANMNAFLQERITGMKIVQIFNAEKQEAEKFKVINKSYTSANRILFFITLSLFL